MNPAKQTAAAIKVVYGEKTDLSNRLSYANGVQNVLGVKRTNTSIRLRVSNGGDTDQIIYMCPLSILGVNIKDTERRQQVFEALRVPDGIPFFFEPEEDEDGGMGVMSSSSSLVITSLNRDQNKSLLAAEMQTTPIWVTGISMKSYTVDNGKDSSNYANSITHYAVSSLRPMRYQDLNLGEFQNTGDFSTDILKVDLVKQSFPGVISANDLIGFQVNGKTRLDITFHIGARDSQAERFYRDVVNGNNLLNDPMWGDSSCSCK